MRSSEQKRLAHGRVSTVAFVVTVVGALLANTAAALYFRSNPDRAALDKAYRARPVMVATPATLQYDSELGGKQPAEQTITITREGEGEMTVSATTAAEWLQITEGKDQTQPIKVSVKIAGLAPGLHPAEIKVSAPEAENDPLLIPVVLMIKPRKPDRLPAYGTSPGGEGVPAGAGYSSSAFMAGSGAKATDFDIILYNRRATTVKVVIYDNARRYCTESIAAGGKKSCRLRAGRQYWVSLPDDQSFQPRSVVLSEDYPVNLR